MTTNLLLLLSGRLRLAGSVETYLRLCRAVGYLRRRELRLRPPVTVATLRAPAVLAAWEPAFTESKP